MGDAAGVPGAGTGGPAEIGPAETTFRAELLRLMEEAGWQPWRVPPVVATSLFSDRRRWLEPHVWAILEGIPGKPTVIAHADRSTEDAEQRMAAYLAWVSSHRPFWRTHAVLVSAVTPRPAGGEAMPDETLAHHLGHELSFAVPGTDHAVVTTKSRGKTGPARLAAAAFAEIRRHLGCADHGTKGSSAG